MQPEVHASNPLSINIETGGVELSVYYPDYCDL